MPELPDVTWYQRYFNATALHKTIQKATVTDTRILDGVSARELEAKLRGKTLESTQRYGKYLFAHTNAGPVLRLHFGMTGTLKYFKEMVKEPEHDRLRLDFLNGYHLAYVCQRLFGSVGLIHDVGAFIRAKKLGPDALRTDFESFRASLTGRRGSVKSALMNQHVVAGLGNVYSDEVLFRSRLHPAIALTTLDEGRIKKLFEAMKSILQTAIDHRADARRMPGDFFIHYRRVGARCPRCNAVIEPLRISGRRAWYCTRCQGKVS